MTKALMLVKWVGRSWIGLFTEDLEGLGILVSS